MSRITWCCFALWLFSGALLAQSTLPPKPLVASDGIGLAIHFTQPQPGEMKMLADAGFKWVRMDFVWAATEKEKGVYDFSEYDKMLKALNEYSIRAYWILDYSNRLYDNDLSPHSPEGIEAFAKWAGAAAAHFKGNPIVWEEYNEPNIQFWRPTPDASALARLSLATGKAIHAADPNATFVGPATSEVAFDYIEMCFKAGCLNDWAAVSVHPYRHGGPEPAADEYRQLRTLITRYAPPGKQIPVLSGEWGYSTIWQSVGDDGQAKFFARQMLTNIENSIPISIWYDWRDDFINPTDQEAHFGIVLNEYHPGKDPVYEPKPAYFAAKALTHAVHGMHLLKRISTDNDNDHTLLFGDGTHLRLVGWTTDRKPHAASVPVSGDSFTRVSYVGETQAALLAQNGELKFDLTDAPQYLTCPDNDKNLLAAPAWAPSPFSVGISDDGNMCHVGLVGAWPAQFKGRIEFEDLDPATKQPIAPQSVQADSNSKLLRFDVKLPASADHVHRLQVRVFADDGSCYYRSPRLIFSQWPFDSVVDNATDLPVEAQPDGDGKVASDQTLSIAPQESNAPAIGPIMRLTYRFDPGWKFVRLAPRNDAIRKLPPDATSIGMWVRGSNEGRSLCARFVDSTGQCFQTTSPEAATRGQDWAFVRFSLVDSSAYWGGAKDGIVHTPVHLDTVVSLDNITRRSTSGKFDVLGPTLFYDR